MIDHPDLMTRVADLSTPWIPTERERIEIAAIGRAYLKYQEWFVLPPSEAITVLCEDLRKGQHWNVCDGTALVETAMEISRVCQQAAAMLEILDRISASLARQLSQSIERNAKGTP